MNELWVARDLNGSLSEFTTQPWLGGGVWAAPIGKPSGFKRLIATDYPDLKPGQCRRLVLAEETSE